MQRANAQRLCAGASDVTCEGRNIQCSEKRYTIIAPVRLEKDVSVFTKLDLGRALARAFKRPKTSLSASGVHGKKLDSPGSRAVAAKYNLVDTSSCSVCCVKKGRERLREALDKRAEAKPLSRLWACCSGGADVVGVLGLWEHCFPKAVIIVVPAMQWEEPMLIKYVQVQGVRRERLRNSDG